MRRLAYAIASLLVIGLAAAGLFTHSRPVDGRALLISAAEAMETSQTLHILFTGVSSLEKMQPMPGEGEMWLSDRAVLMRYLGPDDVLKVYVLLDADEAVWCTYDGEKQILYEADLGGAAERLPEILSTFNRLLREGQVTSLEVSDHPDADVSVERVRRDRREVDRVTFVYRLPSPSKVIVRRVFDIDVTSHRLLSVHRYVRTEETPEKLLDSVYAIRYDQPMPSDLDRMPVLPDSAKVVSADVSVEETEAALSLVMKVGGEEIGRCDVPKAE